MPPILTLAPIRGITDAVYRSALARCFDGFDLALAPFIRLRQGQPLRPSELRQTTPELDCGLRTIPQVLTKHAPTFSAALFTLHAAGHDEVNWNLGCPYPTVASRGRGAGLLPYPEQIDTILAQVLENSPVRLSVKMRLGYRNPDEFLAVLEVLNRYPLTKVILHPRTAKQLYGGTVDLNRAAQAAALCRMPFEYNGDITDLGGFRKLCQLLPGTTTWMIGRGALACPFLPALLKGTIPPAPAARHRQLSEFHGLLLEGYREWLSGPKHLLDKMKEQWTYLAFAFVNPRQILSRIRRCENSFSYAATVAWIFAQEPAPLGDEPPPMASPSSPQPE